MVAELLSQARAAGPRIASLGVGGFGRTHRHWAQERSCLFLPQMVWARCHTFRYPSSPGHSRKMGGKALELGRLPAGLSGVKVVLPCTGQAEQFHSGNIYLGTQAQNSKGSFNPR